MTRLDTKVYRYTLVSNLIKYKKERNNKILDLKFNWYNRISVEVDGQVDISYLYNRKGEQCRYIEIVQDITELKCSLEEQKQQNQLITAVQQSIKRFLHVDNQVATGVNELSLGAIEQAKIIESCIKMSDEIAIITLDNIEHANKTNKISTVAKIVK